MPRPDIDRLTEEMRRQYRDLPGLALTREQAARLWHLPHAESEALLRRLVDEQFLVCARSGHYRRGGAA